MYIYNTYMKIILKWRYWNLRMFLKMMLFFVSIYILQKTLAKINSLDRGAVLNFLDVNKIGSLVLNCFQFHFLNHHSCVWWLVKWPNVCKLSHGFQMAWECRESYENGFWNVWKSKQDIYKWLANGLGVYRKVFKWLLTI